MLLVDSHCHLDRLNYTDIHQSVDQVLVKAKQRDVGFVLAVAINLPGFSKMVELIGDREDVAYSCGVHPLDIDDSYSYEELHRLASQHKVVAIGETGLDYYYQTETKHQQKSVFLQHIQLAREYNKPLIVHTRSARQDTLTLLAEGKADECGGVLHCFTEDIATARTLLDMGFYISFSGIITFRTAEELRDIARFVPLDRLLIETDSPYLAPVPHRGKENQPAFVRDVAEYMAVLKGVSLTELAEATTNNFCTLFRVKLPR